MEPVTKSAPIKVLAHKATTMNAVATKATMATLRRARNWVRNTIIPAMLAAARNSTIGTP